MVPVEPKASPNDSPRGGRGHLAADGAVERRRVDVERSESRHSGSAFDWISRFRVAHRPSHRPIRLQLRSLHNWSVGRPGGRWDTRRLWDWSSVRPSMAAALVLVTYTTFQ